MKTVCSGFVVRTFPFADSGLIVKMLTDSGRFYSFLVRGARRKGKQAQSVFFSPMAHIQISFSERENKTLFTAQSVSSDPLFATIQHDLEKTAVCMYWAEALYRLHPEEQSDVELYRMVAHFMHLLDEGTELRHLPQAFLCSLVGLMGVSPQGNYTAETPCFSIPLHAFCADGFTDPAHTLSGSEAEYVSALFQGFPLQAEYTREVRRMVRRRLEEYLRLHVNAQFFPVSGEVLETVFD
jgi:recombinational DNA repair protein (RecF pathway)